MPPSTEPKGKLGLLAGGGALPRRIRDACGQSARALHVIVLEGQGDPADFINLDHTVTRLGAAGGIIKTLKTAGCTELVFAGTVRRPSLKDLRPDWWAASLPPLRCRRCGNERGRLFRRVQNEYPTRPA